MSTAKTELAVQEQEPAQGTLILNETPHELMPSFMGADNKLGTEGLEKFITPPRIKCVQGTKSGETYKGIDAGTLLLIPQMEVLAKRDEPFWFVPLIWFTEYSIQNPLSMKGTLPFIRERTRDGGSEIARIARNADLRNSLDCTEAVALGKKDKEAKLSYVESFVFIIQILKPELMGLPVVMAFQKGEHRAGSNFITKLKARRAPICGCVFEAVVPSKERTNVGGNSWFGIDIDNPKSEGCPPPFVQNAMEYEALRKRHIELAEQLANDLIRAEYDDEAEPLQGGDAEKF